MKKRSILARVLAVVLVWLLASGVFAQVRVQNAFDELYWSTIDSRALWTLAHLHATPVTAMSLLSPFKLHGVERMDQLTHDDYLSIPLIKGGGPNEIYRDLPFDERAYMYQYKEGAGESEGIRNLSWSVTDMDFDYIGCQLNINMDWKISSLGNGDEIEVWSNWKYDVLSKELKLDNYDIDADESYYPVGRDETYEFLEDRGISYDEFVQSCYDFLLSTLVADYLDAAVGETRFGEDDLGEFHVVLDDPFL